MVSSLLKQTLIALHKKRYAWCVNIRKKSADALGLPNCCCACGSANISSSLDFQAFGKAADESSHPLEPIRPILTLSQFFFPS